MSAKPDWWTSDHWATPPTLVHELAIQYGPFDLDPCCHAETAKAPKFYTPAEDGLSSPWHGKVFMNPPYSDVSPWLEKAIAETRAGRVEIVVALLPACTDTAWFHTLVQGHAEVRFLRGRVRFYGWMATPISSPKSPSMLAIYRMQLNEESVCKP